MNIENLISKYLDGELPPELEAEMHYRLSLSPEARKLFRDHMVLWGAARDRGLLLEPSSAMRSTLFDRLAHEGMNRATAGEAAGGLERLIQSQDLPNSIPPGVPAHALSGWIRWGIPVVCALASAVVFWRYATQSENAPAASAAPKPATRSIAQSSTRAASPLDSHLMDGTDQQAPAESAPAASNRGDRGSLRAQMYPAPRRSAYRASLGFPGRSSAPSVPLSAHDHLPDSDPQSSSSKNSRIEAHLSKTPSSSSSPETALLNGHAKLGVGIDSTNGGTAASNHTMDRPAAQTSASKSDGAVAPMSDKATASGAVDSLTLAMRSHARDLMSNVESTPEYLTPVIAARGSFFTQNHTLPGPDYTLGLGVEFPGGEHQLYALLGRSGYRLSESVIVSNSGTTLRSESSETVKGDLWYGMGYRYSLSLATGVKVGAAIEGGIGGRYFRVGTLIPVGYELNDMIRLELAPTLQYLSAIGETTTSSVSTVGGNLEQQAQSLEVTHQVRVGAGLGVSILFR